MIEFCSKKRMLATIIFLGGLTLIVLIFESHWAFEASSYNHRGNYSNLSKNTSDYCWLRETFSVVEACKPCSEFEVKSQLVKACVDTGYKERVKCHKSDMGDLYLEVGKVSGGVLTAPLETVICLTVFEYLKSPDGIRIWFVLSEDTCEGLVQLPRGHDHGVISLEDVPEPSRWCCFPTFQCGDSISCIAGLCGVLRQVITVKKNTDGCDLLGFRDACLAACAEVSVWTKFCEVELTTCTKEVILHRVNSPLLPVQLARLENHLSLPIRVHNISKFKDKEHKFVEGPFFTLADILISTQVYIILTVLDAWQVECIPLTMKWLFTVLNEFELSKNFSKYQLRPLVLSVDWVLPHVNKESLYKSDPTRYKPKHKIFTQQCDIITSIDTVSKVALKDYADPVGSEIELNEKELPLPDVPPSRLDRKLQQLINLTKATLQVSNGNDIIVDFCSGSGHLGLMVAHCLPNSTVILLDNKEISLKRAKKKIETLALKNVYVIQANLDYFVGTFQVGISLHACGVASDLVILKCLKMKANIVICPCCYGGIQTNHIFVYPQSEEYRNAGLTERGYLVLGHCADQSGTDQGELGMRAVDTDRCLLAEGLGYQVTLAKLIPPSCTTRNNLIVAIKMF